MQKNSPSKSDAKEKSVYVRCKKSVRVSPMQKNSPLWSDAKDIKQRTHAD
jgi:hypothetical protein